MVLRRLVIALLMSPALACAALAQQGQINIDPETKQVTITGWDKEAASTGTIFYVCASEECKKGSTVSLHLQDEVISWDEQQLRSKEEELLGRLRAAGLKKTEDTISNVRIKNGKDLRVGSVDHRLSGPELATAGVAPFWTTGFVTVGGKSYTIASSAPDAESASANFGTFVFVSFMSACYDNPLCKTE